MKLSEYLACLYFVFMGILGSGAIVGMMVGGSSRQEPVKPYLATPLSLLANAEVVCPGSASAATRVPASGTPASSFLIVNSSATCVRVGGSGVTSTTGGSVGDGCTLGTSISVDARSGFCVSSGAGTVTVQVLYGVQ